MGYRIGIIGGGNMGAAIVRGSLKAGVFKPSEVIVAEIDALRRQVFVDLGCATTSDPADASRADQILLAVKPQAFPEVARQIGMLSGDVIAVSIMAGLNSAYIRTLLGGQVRIVRAMPNIPCQIGEGMTGIALGSGAKPGDERMATAMFNAIGRSVMVDESLMYAVTAVSGSGPAYVFLLAEAMEQAAIALNIDPSTARLLVEQTIKGAGRLMSESTDSAAALRTAVTSPGGTTAAAIDVFDRFRFNDIVIEALAAARDRGAELDRKS